MKKRYIILISIVSIVILLIAGGITANLHNSSAYKETSDSYEKDYYTSMNSIGMRTGDAEIEFSENYETEETLDNEFISKTDDNQKLIYTGDVSISSENIDKTYQELVSYMNKNNGKIESMSKSASTKKIIMRIPSENFLKMYDSLENLYGEISDSSMDVKDKTKEYTETAKKIEILETEYNELKEMMEQSNDVQDLLAVKDRMVNVTYELEFLKSRNETIDYDANYSILSVWISSSKYEEPEVESFGTQFKNSLRASIYGLKLFILFLVRIWWIIIILITIIIFIIKRARHKKKN